MKARLPKEYSGGASDMNTMIRKAQKMKEGLTKAQQELETKEYTVTSGGGAVEVQITGKREIKSITIKPEAVDPNDIEMLQDLVVAAVNEAIRKVDAMSDMEMEKVTGGISMPGLF